MTDANTRARGVANRVVPAAAIFANEPEHIEDMRQRAVPHLLAYAHEEVTRAAFATPARVDRDSLAATIFAACPDRFMRVEQCYPAADAILALLDPHP